MLHTQWEEGIQGKPGPSGLLDTTYIDPLTGQPISYGVHNLPAGMVASFLAGNISGLLGIGGGVIKVPVMNLIMRIPLRAAIATSNFMIGITAGTSALIYSGKVRKFTPEEVNFAIAVADIGAIAIENAKLHEVLKQRLAALKEDVDGWYQFLAFS